MSIANYPVRQISTNNIFLDHENPRLQIKENNPSQEELIYDLLNNHKVIELCQSIQRNGLFPGENHLYAIEENGKFIVVEGNRRLAAIKLLLDPEKSNDEYKSRISKISAQSDTDSLKKMTIVLAPDRDSIIPYLIERHTGNSLEKWSRTMQSQYVYDLIKRGHTVEDITNDTKYTRSEIVKFLRNYEMYVIACNLDLDDSLKEKLLDKEKFPLTNLERILDRPIMQTFLGVYFDESGEPNIDTNESDFKTRYSYVITDLLRDGGKDSRNLNDDIQFKAYVNEELKEAGFTSEAPKKTTDFDKKKLYEGASSQTDAAIDTVEQTEKPTRRRSVRSYYHVIPSSIPFKLKNAASLKKMYNELRKISYNVYPNTATAMFRVFLDKSLRLYIKKSGFNKIPIKKNNVMTDVNISDASFGELIDYIIRKDVDIVKDSSAKKAIKLFKNSDQLCSLFTLNSVIHEDNIVINSDEFGNEIYPRLECFLTYVLTEPEGIHEKK